MAHQQGDVYPSLVHENEEEHRRQLAESVTHALNEIQDLREAILAIYAFAAYGGLNMSTPDVVGPNIGLAWQTLDDYDTLGPATPRGVTASLANSSLTFDNPGVYAVSFSIWFTHNEQNSSREFQLRFYNLTDGQQVGAPFIIGTGRNTHVSGRVGVFISDIPEALTGKEFVLQIGNTTDSYTTVLWDVQVFQAWNVGQWMGDLTSGSYIQQSP